MPFTAIWGRHRFHGVWVSSSGDMLSDNGECALNNQLNLGSRQSQVQPCRTQKSILGRRVTLTAIREGEKATQGGSVK